MSYYPIYLELEGKNALVVGGGKVALRKIETLLEYGALVKVVSKELSAELTKMVEQGKVEHVGEVFQEKHLDQAFLVFAATDNNRINHAVSESARNRAILVNAVDQPQDCDFIVPSIIRKGNLSIAISTSGKSPALAKSIRKQLDAQFGQEYESFLILMGRLRVQILSLGLSQEENARIFQKIVHSDILHTLAEDNWAGVEDSLSMILPTGVNTKDLLTGLEKS